MANFHQKWRYNIRLAERKGVTVQHLRQGDGPRVLRSDAHDRRARRLRDPQARILCGICLTISASMPGSIWRSTPSDTPDRRHPRHPLWRQGLVSLRRVEQRASQSDAQLSAPMAHDSVGSRNRTAVSTTSAASPATCRRITRSTVCSASSRASAAISPSLSARWILSSPPLSIGRSSTARPSSRNCANRSTSFATVENKGEHA